MVKIDKSVGKNIKLIKEIYGNSGDLNTRVIKIGKTNVGILFMESSSSPNSISDFIIKSIDIIKKETKLFGNVFETIKNNIYNSQLIITEDFLDFSYYLSSGFTIIVVDNEEKAIVLETRADLDRGVSEATNEPVLRGPKDSFTESHAKNLGLIRKRIKDNNLWFDEIKMGTRTKTRVSIGFISDIVNEDDIVKIKNTLLKINIDGIIDSGTLKEYLVKNKASFPQIQSTERPDLTSLALLNGKIIILVENSPYALILPSVFSDFLHTSEDEFQNPKNISFTRILKVIALLVTLFTPAIYIAITTFDQAVVPNKLLISLAIQREGVPFPTFFEVILLMMIFEILRESDIRLPANMGASMSIVGALVLGEAAVNASIVSPIAVIVVAITSICSLIFTDADFINGIRAWRFIFIISATFLGLIGLVCASLCFILKLSSLETFNVSYLAPISPFSKKDAMGALFKNSTSKTYRRPSYLKIKNKIKQR